MPAGSAGAGHGVRSRFTYTDFILICQPFFKKGGILMFKFKSSIIALLIVIVMSGMFLAVSAFTGPPIESNAIISKNVSSRADTVIPALVGMVKAYGWRCDSVSAAREMVFSSGYVLICNQFSYEYEIIDKGGRWFVKVK